MRGLLFLLAPLALNAQLALFSFDGSTDTAAGASYNYGTVGAGAAKDVRFHVKNTGTAAINNVVIGTPQGAGFSIAAINGSWGQNTLAPQQELEFTIRFLASGTQPATGTYSASLQITSNAPPLIVILLASVIPAPVVTIFPACTPNGNGAIAFPDVAIGSMGLCNFSVQNQSSLPMTVTVALAGDPAFQASAGIAAPVTIKPNDAITFSIQFTPVCGTLNYAATLTVNGQALAISAKGLTPPLPRPVIAFDTPTASSGEQHTVSMSLPAAAVCAANGYLNLAFIGPVPDASIVFLAGSTRALPFSVKAGSTQISLNGQASATFQTGTSAGTLSFSVSGVQVASDPTTTLIIPPAPVVIETAAASNQKLGELDIQIVGFDNTYTTGAMSFTFFDASGKTLASASSDFSSSFKTYFGTAASGSSFLMRVSFPVQGTQSQVAKVAVTLTNAAGQTQTGNLTFQ
jgi:hypothetical protein